MRYANDTINKLLDDKKITQNEYNILFSIEEKHSRNFTEQDFFNKTLQKIIELQKADWILDLSYIKFPKFNFKYFSRNEEQILSFNDAEFFSLTEFAGLDFKNDVNFIGTKFYNDVSFAMSTFSKRAYFLSNLFYANISFRGAESKNIFHFTNNIFTKIDLVGSYFSNIDIHNLLAFNDNKALTTLSKKNFKNMESAQLLKMYLEKQNIIPEANKYFQIEQELYLDKLKDKESLEPNKSATKFVLYLNKFVSNFGTDWIRPLLVMFIFSFLASFFYILFSSKLILFIFKNSLIEEKDILLWIAGGFGVSILIYLSYHYKEWRLLILSVLGYIGLIIFSQDFRLITNDISKLINPLNIFKSKDYFEHIAPYGMFVKLIMATLIYQFIMAFRQNTRRK